MLKTPFHALSLTAAFDIAERITNNNRIKVNMMFVEIQKALDF